MFTTPIKRVALAGGSGQLGPRLLSALISAGFEVTVLTRASSDHEFPSEVKVAKVDYDSLDSLTSALKGNDALVSTLTMTSLDAQLKLVDAAIAAGIQRFIPSEFGSDTLNEKNAKLPVFAGKIKTQEYLSQKAPGSGLTYTYVIVGPFFDWGLQVGFIINAPAHSAELYNGGDVPFSTTTLEQIGKAVVGVLKHPKETENRAVYVQNAVVTQNQLIAIGEKLSGGKKWETKTVATDDLYRAATEEMKKEQPNGMIIAYNFIKVCNWADGHGARFDPQKVDNKLLGVDDFGEKEIEDVVKRYI